MRRIFILKLTMAIDLATDRYRLSTNSKHCFPISIVHPEVSSSFDLFALDCPSSGLAFLFCAFSPFIFLVCNLSKLCFCMWIVPSFDPKASWDTFFFFLGCNKPKGSLNVYSCMQQFIFSHSSPLPPFPFPRMFTNIRHIFQKFSYNGILHQKIYILDTSYSG